MFNFEAFTFWIYIYIKKKEDGAQRDEKDKGYVQTCIYCLKSKVQTTHCSKEMWDLLTAVYISKGTTKPLENLPPFLQTTSRTMLSQSGRTSAVDRFQFFEHVHLHALLSTGGVSLDIWKNTSPHKTV